MYPSFDCLYLFENPEIFILEIKRTDVPSVTPKTETHKWLLMDKATLDVTALTFLSMKSDFNTEERFFEQGYLSFDSGKAIYIKESTSKQTILNIKETYAIPLVLSLAIQQLLAKTQSL
ncbi:hypothetical protein [Dyadobacter sp. 3J3]|uniref:hypothetical protein n=1 Tax=Dyadobacter sp. 3J3 TaxID=2606600 RepID=UPI00135B5443|nr:hypothetical protein [Dyadobacter sp. 3J3]